MTTLPELVDGMYLHDLLTVEDRLKRLSERIRPSEKTIEDLREHVAKTISRKIREHVKSPTDLDTLLRALLKV